jgi:hypothetical protein
MAFGALAGAGGPFGQWLWDDPAFVFYREATEAMDRRDHARAAALARAAIEHPGSLAGRRALQAAIDRRARETEGLVAEEQRA